MPRAAPRGRGDQNCAGSACARRRRRLLAEDVDLLSADAATVTVALATAVRAATVAAGVAGSTDGEAELLERQLADGLGRQPKGSSRIMLLHGPRDRARTTCCTEIGPGIRRTISGCRHGCRHATLLGSRSNGAGVTVAVRPSSRCGRAGVSPTRAPGSQAGGGELLAPWQAQARSPAPTWSRPRHNARQPGRPVAVETRPSSRSSRGSTTRSS